MERGVPTLDLSPPPAESLDCCPGCVRCLFGGNLWKPELLRHLAGQINRVCTEVSTATVEKARQIPQAMSHHEVRVISPRCERWTTN